MLNTLYAAGILGPAVLLALVLYNRYLLGRKRVKEAALYAAGAVVALGTEALPSDPGTQLVGCSREVRNICFWLFKAGYRTKVNGVECRDFQEIWSELGLRPAVIKFTNERLRADFDDCGTFELLQYLAELTPTLLLALRALGAANERSNVGAQLEAIEHLRVAHEHVAAFQAMQYQRRSREIFRPVVVVNGQVV